MESFPKKNKVIYILHKTGIYPLRGFVIFYEKRFSVDYYVTS
jgi:hypothetical protein